MLYLPRVIRGNGLDMLQTWVDALYVTYHDMRGYTRGFMSMVQGIIHEKSSKQKINTKSYTETELVRGNDYIPWTVCVDIFLME